MTTLTLPHKFTPRPYQLPFFKAMDSGVKRAVLVWHRRCGKDLAGIAYASKAAFERRGTYYHVYPYYNQGRKAIWDGMDKEGVPFLDRFPKELIKARNEQEMRIEFKNGSAWQVIGSDKVDAIVGTNPVGVVFSEYSLQRPEAYELLRPILAENDGWAVFNFTPRGMNHGWKLLQQAKSEAKWFHEVLTADDTHILTAEQLAAERRSMPQELFEQEYYCRFIEGAGQFFRRIKENTWDGNLEPEPGHNYQLGVDLAKYQDFTVLTPFDLNTFRAGKQDRFNQIDYNLQKSRIEAAAFRFGNARVMLDSTGVGEPIHDDLAARGLAIEPYRFTETSRMDLLKNLALLLEQDKIKIPNDPLLLDELRSFQYSLNEAGKVRVGAPESLHDDMVFSLALATWSIREPLGEPDQEETLSLYGAQSFT